MIVEIRGAGFNNKGAELMLRTTVDRMRRRSVPTNCVIDGTSSSLYANRSALGVGTVFPCQTFLRGANRSLALRSPLFRTVALAAMRRSLPRSASSILGLVDRRDCAALLDISGYAYGDKFAVVRTRVAAETAGEYAKRGKPVIFMPQMFGPFNNPKGAAWFRRAADQATLIYAREQRSLEMVQQLLGDDERVRLAPDITIASLPAKAVAAAGSEPYACVVPNERMVEQGKAEWGDAYLSRLRHVLERVAAAGLRPVLLIHTRDPGDREMADALRSELGEDKVDLFDSPDPYELKSFIGGAEFIVGSRFHSIVAAFSMGVPAIILGWAHKYEMLAKDFGVGDLQHRGADTLDHLTSLLDRMLDTQENQRLRQTLATRGSLLREQVEAMWSEVNATLDRAAS